MTERDNCTGRTKGVKNVETEPAVMESNDTSFVNIADNHSVIFPESSTEAVSHGNFVFETFDTDEFHSRSSRWLRQRRAHQHHHHNHNDQNTSSFHGRDLLYE